MISRWPPDMRIESGARSRLHCPKRNAFLGGRHHAHDQHIALIGSAGLSGAVRRSCRSRPSAEHGAHLSTPIAAATVSTSSTPPPTRQSAISKGIEAAHGVTCSPDGSKIYISNESDEHARCLRRQDLQADQEGQAQRPSQQHRGGQGWPDRGRDRPRSGRARDHRWQHTDQQSQDPDQRAACTTPM